MKRHRLTLAALLLAAASPGSAAADRSFDVALVSQPIDGYGMAMIDRAQTPQRFEIGLLASTGWSLAPLRVTLLDRDMGNTPQPFNLIEHKVRIHFSVEESRGSGAAE